MISLATFVAQLEIPITSGRNTELNFHFPIKRQCIGKRVDRKQGLDFESAIFFDRISDRAFPVNTSPIAIRRELIGKKR